MSVQVDSLSVNPGPDGLPEMMVSQPGCGYAILLCTWDSEQQSMIEGRDSSSPSRWTVIVWSRCGDSTVDACHKRAPPPLPFWGINAVILVKPASVMNYLLGVHDVILSAPKCPWIQVSILETNTVFVVSCSSSQVGQWVSDLDLNKEE